MSHYISLCRKSLPKDLFPRNEHIKLSLCKYVYIDNEVFVYRTSLSKLNFIVSLLIYYIINEDFKNEIKSFEEITKLPCYTYIEDVVYELTRSTFDIDGNQIKDNYPFIDFVEPTSNLDDPALLKLFRNIRNNDEKDFKDVVKTLIFDDEVIIEDGYCEYEDEKIVIWNK